MYRNVLVPLDGSPLAEQALAAGAAVCRRAGARLHLVHVRTMYRHAGDDEVADPERAYLDDVCRRTRAATATAVDCCVIPPEPPQLLMPAPSPGKVAGIIDSYAREHDVDLIVLATHGRGGFSRMWFGSVADAVLRAATPPVLLIRPDDGAGAATWSGDTPVAHVLVPLDGSTEARAAVDPALALGGPFGARYTLLRSIAPPVQVFDGLTPMGAVFTPGDTTALQTEAEADLAASARRLRARGAEVDTAVVVDVSPAQAILAAARDRGVDVIVLSARLRGGLDRLILGSVADKVVRAAEVPVLFIRPAEAAEEQPVPTGAAGG